MTIKSIESKKSTKNAISTKVEVSKDEVINNCKLTLNTKQNIIIHFLLEHKVIKENNEEMKVGLTYQEVLDKSLNYINNSVLFDSNVKTSMNCVRWYASKIKNESLKYYQKESLTIIRPRMSTTSK